jgi:hypothetical protein
MALPVSHHRLFQGCESFEKHPLSPDFSVKLKFQSSKYAMYFPRGGIEIFAFLELKRN